jgi:hypothetical protein
MNSQDRCLVAMPIILSPNTTSRDSEVPYSLDTVYTFLLPKKNRLIKNRQLMYFYIS